ncbi:hypothetical protein QCA50_007483 [Cerrena zonata]|uniref:non-specific serine/threonine protein kinase n=1 Tax=Cerrena zonata TaxID=2478898 RepID=A0AAW0GHJ8_9APHY
MLAFKNPCIRRLSVAVTTRFHCSRNLSSLPDQPSDATSGWEKHEEPLTGYHPPAVNKYCPVNINDTLGHYRILRKLGWGGYSTAWLSESQSPSDPTTSDISTLKLLTTWCTGAQDKLQELEFLRKMRDQAPDHPGHAHVLQLKDQFHHQGPYGQHLCLVTEPLLHNMRIFSMRFPHRIMPLSLVRSVSRQIVLGLQYLHEECNIIHTDLKPDNILMVAPNGQQFFKDLHNPSKSSVATDPLGNTVTRVSSEPLYYPLPGSVAQEDDIWLQLKVKIADVGTACWADKASQHYTDRIQSPALRAPEVAIGAGWGKPADIWSLGCTIYELYMTNSLLPPGCAAGQIPHYHSIFFGQYPEALIERGKHSDIWFNPDGSPKNTFSSQPFDTEIRRRNAPDADVFIDFLRLAFTLDPDQRATCRDLLAHPWLNPDNWNSFHRRNT